MVDADRATATTLSKRLEGLGANVVVVESRAQGLEGLQAGQPFDLILMDIVLPDGAGLGILREMKKDPRGRVIPVIIVTAVGDTDMKVRGLDEGALDYITKPFNFFELLARVKVALRLKYAQDELKRRIKSLEELSVSDPLTSLLNRRTFEQRLYVEMERSRNGQQPVSCLMLDIDWFKDVNDRYGHTVGDDVLQQVARVIYTRRGENDLVCRYGGEEFVWLLPGMDPEAAVELGEWLRRSVEEIEIQTGDGTGDGTVRVTISVGTTTYYYPEHGVVPAPMLLEQADNALLEAKRQGKNRVIYFPLVKEQHGNEESGDHPQWAPVAGP